MRRPTVPPSHRRDRLAALRLSRLRSGSDLFGFFLVGFLIKVHTGQAEGARKFDDETWIVG